MCGLQEGAEIPVPCAADRQCHFRHMAFSLGLFPHLLNGSWEDCLGKTSPCRIVALPGPGGGCPKDQGLWVDPEGWPLFPALIWKTGIASTTARRTPRCSIADANTLGLGVQGGREGVSELGLRVGLRRRWEQGEQSGRGLVPCGNRGRSQCRGQGCSRVGTVSRSQRRLDLGLPWPWEVAPRDGLEALRALGSSGAVVSPATQQDLPPHQGRLRQGPHGRLTVNQGTEGAEGVRCPCWEPGCPHCKSTCLVG